ncbi:RNA-binding domain-containing protein [Streptomyces sp. NPDC049597]|uniref:RNA-binding domain-containing protein n=1 Tax=Streptomyces sp. NPDC049597 TaxID=3155276 RepID=UPI0034377AD8
MNLAGALAALDAHHPDALLELRESQWIDAKKQPYQLSAPAVAEEFAKDVAAFANGGGGVIVIGIATRPERGEEILDHIVGVDPDAVSPDQVRKVLLQRITPAVRGLRIGWSGPDDGQRVAFLHIPVQAPGQLFVVAAPTGKNGAPRPDTVAVPIRDGDGTHWLPRTEVQQLLAAGVKASGMPTPEALAALVQEAAAATRADVLRVGQGLADREWEMRQAHRELAAHGLGAPAGEAREHGTAALQDFHHTQPGKLGWVLCLVADRPPVAVAAPVWQAITDAGRADVGQDALAAIGFPVPPAGVRIPWLIEADAQCLELAGGHWGAGRLMRLGNDEWRWQPRPHFSLQQGRSATAWTSGQTPALRLRVVVNLPWAGTDALEITRTRRHQLEQQLPFSSLAGAMTMLSKRRGTDLRAERWERTASGNSSRSLAYACTLTAPDGATALRAAAMLSLPTPMDSSVIACAELLVDDKEAWAALLSPGGWDTQLGLEEAQAVLLGAWETAAELLPEAIGTPGLRWSAPPTSELRLSSERPEPNGVLPPLVSALDLTPFGDGEDHRQSMAVTITATPRMAANQRRNLLRQALVHMARAFGYVDADLDALQ